jgi:hypothetical protein
MSEEGSGRTTRRDFLRGQAAAAGLAASVAGCNFDGWDGDGGRDGETDVPPGRRVAGQVLDTADTPVSGTTVAALGTVKDADSSRDPSPRDSRVLGTAESDTEGLFELTFDALGPDESVVSVAKPNDVVLVAQFVPERPTPTDPESPPDAGHRPWFGAYALPVGDVRRGVNVRLTLDKQLLYNGWDAAPENADLTVWRTVHDNPRHQRISVELRGNAVFNRGKRYISRAGVPRGQLSVDLPEAVNVDHPNDRRFRPLLATPELFGNTDNYAGSPVINPDSPKWWEMDSYQPTLSSWENTDESLAATFQTGVSEPLFAPLAALFGRDGFTPFTTADRREHAPDGDPGSFSDEMTGLLTNLLGETPGSVGTAVSTASFLYQLGSYAGSKLDVPADSDDPNVIGNGWTPDDAGRNHYDTLSVSWLNGGNANWPPAVVHDVDVTVSVADNNRRPVTVSGAWEAGLENEGARFEHGLLVAFDRVSPLAGPRVGQEDTETPTPTPTPTPAAKGVTGRWPQPLADARNTGYLGATGPTGGVEKDWTFNASEEYDGLFGTHYAPVTDGNLLYVATELGPLFALRPDGSVEWAFTEPRPRDSNGLEPSGVAVGDDHVYMTMRETVSPATEGSRPAVYAVSRADGSLEEGWTYSFPDNTFDGRYSRVAMPTVVNGTVYVFGIDTGTDEVGTGPLVALDAETGDVTWRTEVTGVWENQSGYPPAVTDTAVYLNTRDRFHAYDAESGDLLWESDDSGVSDFSPVAVTGEMALCTGLLPDSEGEDALVGYDVSSVASGTVRRAWTAFGDTFEVEPVNPTVDPTTTTAYVTNPGPRSPDELYPVDTETGEAGEPFVDESVDAGETSLLFPSVTDDVVYVSDTYGTLVGFDRESGERRLKLEHNGAVGVTVTGGRVFVGDEELTAWSGTESPAGD